MFQEQNNLKSLPAERPRITSVVGSTLDIPPAGLSLLPNLNRKKVTVYVSGQNPVNIAISGISIVTIEPSIFKEIIDEATLSLQFSSIGSSVLIAEYF